MSDKQTAAITEMQSEIDKWVSDQIEDANGSVPDFWDELNTSERLAEHLITHGWVKTMTDAPITCEGCGTKARAGTPRWYVDPEGIQLCPSCADDLHATWRLEGACDE